MNISSRSGIIILFATVAVCTLVLFPLLQYVAERDPQLSAYDDDWNDISNFRKSLEEDLDSNYNVSAVLSNPGVLDEISNPSSTLFVIVGTESPYSSLELEILARYMENGGSILVFGDFDYSDTIVRFISEKELLKDKRLYRPKISLVRDARRNPKLTVVERRVSSLEETVYKSSKKVKYYDRKKRNDILKAYRRNHPSFKSKD